MPTNTPLQFTDLPNTRVAFANAAAWNTYWGNAYVTIEGANLPVPTTTTLGGVKLLEIAAFSAPGQVNTYTTISVDGGITTQDFPTKEAYVLLAAQVQYLADYITLLKAQLDAKGYVAA